MTIDTWAPRFALVSLFFSCPFACESGGVSRETGGREDHRLEGRDLSDSSARADRPPPSGDALADKINSEISRNSPEYRPTSSMVRLKLDKRTTQSFKTRLPGSPYCHAFAVAAADNVKGFTISIASPPHKTMARKRSENSPVTLTDFCPSTPGEYILTVKTKNGASELAVQVFSAALSPVHNAAN